MTLGNANSGAATGARILDFNLVARGEDCIR